MMVCECSAEELDKIAVWSNSPFCPICGEKMDKKTKTDNKIGITDLCVVLIVGILIGFAIGMIVQGLIT